MKEKQIKRTVILVLLVLAIMLLPVCAEASVSKLHVEKSKLVNESGKTVQLKGISTHGINWSPEYINDKCFRQLKKEWKCNVVRISIYTEEYNGYCSGADKKSMRKLVNKAVSLAEKNNMYVIIDWHILSDGNPNKHLKAAKTFFNIMSKKHASSNNVIYEICNEPNGNVSWSTVKKYANKVIPVIRKNDPDSIVIVGTPTWSQDVDRAAASPLKYKNTMYAFHFYADTHRETYRKKLESAVKSGLPVFVSEYGICDASGNGKINKNEAGKWMKLLDKYKISSCMWNLSNKNESSAVIKSTCKKKYGFTYNNLSASGKWLLKMLGGKTAATQVPAEDVDSKEVSFEGISGSCNGVEYNSVPVNSWESDAGKYYQLNLTVTNRTGADITSWKVDIPADGISKIEQSWNCEAEIDRDFLVVSNAGYNGSIKAGETVSNIGIIVTVRKLQKV